MKTHIVHVNTKDYCVIESLNFLECIMKMSNVGRVMIDNIKDDEGGVEKYMLCFAKGEFLNQYLKQNG